MKSDFRLLVDKPADISSFGVVARVRKKLTNELGKKIKVGHTGTLDPFATGLMILLIGRECKNAGSYSKLDKVYEAKIRLGATSSTGDPEGEITMVSASKPSLNDISVALKKFTGKIVQQPPIYSAIKINGQRAYKLARSGEKIEMPKREVTIYNLQLLKYDYPYLTIQSKVSSGTYIRTLAEDIGKELGTGAYCEELRRIEVGDFSVNDAVSLDEFCKNISNQTLEKAKII